MKFLAEIPESLAMSWGAVRANKLRSALATIGIVIGIVTVTLMGAAINGLDQAFVVKAFPQWGGRLPLFIIPVQSWLNDSYDNWFKIAETPAHSAGERRRRWRGN